MRRLLPHPFVSAVLFVLWLLLNETVSPGPALVGLVLAVAGGWMLQVLEPGRAGPWRLGAAARLLAVVSADVIQSNIAVARVILHPHRPDRRAGFMRVPIGLRDPLGLAALACILTATPGTAWVEFDAAEGSLLLHVLDLGDEEEWVRIIKERYEQPLLEIFP